MKKNYILTLFITLCFSVLTFGQDLLITGIIDGPLPGGYPKGIELYAVNAIPDLSIYGIESAGNGSAAAGVEYTFPADAITAGTYIYLASSDSSAGFVQYLGVTPQYEDGVVNINGDDTVILYKNAAIEDSIGVIGEDGSGKDWEHLDGWAYRKDGKGPNATFDSTEWSFSGINALDGCDKADDTGTNAECGSVFPVGTYKKVASTKASLSIASPTDNQIFPSGTTNIQIALDVQNFTLSGDNGSEMTDNAGDGYIKGTLYKSGILDGTKSIFSGTETDIENAVDGETYGITAELVDNSGASLSPKVEISITFSVAYPCDIELGAITTTCNAETVAIDTYDVSIPFTGANTSTYTLTTDSGTIGGDSPSNTASGTITISGVAEGTDVVFSLTGDVSNSVCDVTKNISSPTCVPAPTCPAVGSLIVTEIMQNPDAVADSSGEYFEVYNTSNAAIDMLGWTIKSLTTSSKDHVIASSLVVSAGGYVVLGINSDVNTNGGVTVDYEYGSNFYLGNGSDSVALECGASVIDSVTWDNGDTFPDPTGKSMELATNKYNATANDSGANWAEAVAEISTGADLGTPGAVNSFVLGIANNSIKGFATYPNPVTNNKFTLTSNSASKKTVTIFNVLGKKVLSSSFNGVKSNVDVSSISSGIYILKVTEDGKTATKKLVIR